MGWSKSTDLFWSFYHTTDRLTGEEAGFLCPAEKRRLAGMRFEKRRTDWLTGRWAIKSLLARCGILSPSAGLDCIQILNEESGAPYAADLSGVRLPGRISISHRAGAAFCAYSPTQDARIGADLELIEAKEVSFFEDYFTAGEKAIAMQCGGKDRDLAILLAWSGKEAVFKALGTGMRLDTRSVETGGYAWIADHPSAENEWHELIITSQIPDAFFSGRWMLRGSFVLALAWLTGQGGPSPVHLHAF